MPPLCDGALGSPCPRLSRGFFCAGGAQRVSVAKVQVGLLGSARGLQRDLERIAKRSDTSSSEGLAYVLQGAAFCRPRARAMMPGPAWRLRL